VEFEVDQRLSEGLRRLPLPGQHGAKDDLDLQPERHR